MRYLIGFIVALLVGLVLLETDIPEFLSGWISCMAFYSAKEFYLFIKQNQ